ASVVSSTRSLHDALPILYAPRGDTKSVSAQMGDTNLRWMSRAPDGGCMSEYDEMPRGDWPEFYLAEIVAQTNKRSLALAIRRELDRKSTRLNSSHVKISY